MSSKTTSKRVIVSHVYLGGGTTNNFNRQAFTMAISTFNALHCTMFIICQCMTCKDVKDKKWGYKDLIDWLHNCDLHFILTHLHQGSSGKGGQRDMGWDVDKLYQYLERLSDHPGFPTGIQLRCPIFTQNKFGYLHPLMSCGSFVNNTMLVRLRQDGNYDSVQEELNR